MMQHARNHLARGCRLVVVALVVALTSACTSNVETALRAADVAAARGMPEREEALLKTIEMRLSRARARGRATNVSCTQERAILTRLAALYAGPLHLPDAAIDTWEQALLLAPPAEEAGALLVTMADFIGHRQGDRATAAAQFERASLLLGRRPAAASALLAAAEHYLALGNADKCIGLCERLMDGWQGATDAARAQLLVGEAKRQAGDVQGAIDSYVALLDLKPSGRLSSITKAKLAQAHQARGESAQALDYYHAALAEHPNAPMVQDAIARVREQMVQIAPHKSILRGVGGAAPVARR